MILITILVILILYIYIDWINVGMKKIKSARNFKGPPTKPIFGNFLMYLYLKPEGKLSCLESLF